MVERLKSPETPKSEFVVKLETQWKRGNFICVGLDSDSSVVKDIVSDKIASSITDKMLYFNKKIIDETGNKVCAYKPNTAFYEAEGAAGMTVLKETISYIKTNYPSVLVILDGKRGDIGNTNNGTVKWAFDELGADAVTVHPFLGKEAMKPFLDRKDKGIIVLVKTSNPGAAEFQDLKVGEKQEPLYQVVARNVAQSWNYNGNCAVVVGATYPKELAEVKRIVGDMPILIPGIGAQGGELEATVKAGKDSRNMGMIISSSRGIIFASKGPDFAQVARKVTQDLKYSINQLRK